MSRLLPIRTPITSNQDHAPRLVEIDDDAADEVFEALSSKTARTIFSFLHTEPATASDLAEVADTSLQNIRYHLVKLTEAGLVEIVDTWYSDRGREMKVYAPANTSLVVLSGSGPAEMTLRNVLSNLIGGIGVLGLASLLFDGLVNGLSTPSTGGTSANVNYTSNASPTLSPTPKAAADGGGIVTPTPTGTTAVERTVVQERTVVVEVSRTQNETATATTTPVGGVEGGGAALDLFGVAVPPGAIFFVGGLFVLLLVLGWVYYRRRRPYAA